MTAMIEAGTLKTIRKARKIGRPKLAKLTGTTERQISRLEAKGAGPIEIAPGLLMRLSDALWVQAGVLTGDVPLSDADLGPLPATCCSNKGCCG